jgi:hypothetical protein
MTSSGYSAVDNLTPSDPGYVNRAAKDFRLREDSPCRAVTDPTGSPVLENAARPGTTAPAPGADAPRPPKPPRTAPNRPRGASAASSRVPRLSVRLAATSIGRGRVAFRGRLGLRAPGATTGHLARSTRIRFEVRRGGRWRTAARGMASPAGAFRVRSGRRLADRSRPLTVRAVAHGVGRSAAVRLRVR